MKEQKPIRSPTFEELELEKKTLTHISLFAGCGGFDLGLSMAGFQSRVMVEWSKDCCATLRANWWWSELKKRKHEDGTPLWKTKEEMKKQIKHYFDIEPAILQEDITKLSTQKILEAGNLKVGETTIITGGPPCQGFSTAGLRMIDDPRNSLFKEFVRIVREALPKMMIMENVPGMISTANGEVIKQICEEFSKCGYDITWQILNAADYGVPQNRKRVFLVGQRIDVMKFTEDGRAQLHMGAVPGEIKHPESFMKKHKLVDYSKQTTLGDSLEDKEPKNIQELFIKLRRGK